MDAKRFFCLVLLTSLLAGCGQPAATPTPTPAPVPLKNPWSLFVDSAGRIYVVDWTRGIVRLDDFSGRHWTAYGSMGRGNGVGQFNGSEEVFVDSAARIYVADYSNHRIVRFDDMNGSNWVALGSSWLGGDTGTGEGQFNRPAGIFVAGDGRIYVTDSFNHRVVRVDDMYGSNWTAYGSYGSGTGEFKGPSGIALDSAGRIYIVDRSNDRIVRIDDMSGANWVSYGSMGSGIGEFSYPLDICLDGQDRIYVTDTNMRIVRIDDMSGSNWVAYGSAGSGVGQFTDNGAYDAFHIFVDVAGRIYIADRSALRLARIDDMNGTNWTTLP